MSRLLSGKAYVIKLKALGLTKWKIAAELGVHWNTVRRWERGVFKAKESHRMAMKEILEQREGCYRCAAESVRNGGGKS